MSFERCVQKYLKYFEDEKTNSSEDDRARKSTIGVITKRITAKSFEVSEVEQLNPHMVSVSRPSDVAEKVNNKRKLQHELLMAKLANDLHTLNLKVEENIKISSKELKAYMKHYKDELSGMLRSLDIPEVASYHASVFLDIQKKSDSMRSHQLQLVHELYEDLVKFERMRSKESEKIFQLSFKEIEKTAYILPYDVQTFVEHETLKIDQLILNNRRCYEDLKLHLILVTEETFKSFMDEVFCIKKKWVRYQERVALEEMHSKKEAKSVTVIPKPIQRLELKGHELKFHLTADKCHSSVKNEEWFDNVKAVMVKIEQHLDVMINMHTKLVRAVRSGLGNECVENRKSLLSLDVVHFEERSIQPIIFETGLVAEEGLEELEQCWQTILNDLKVELANIHTFVTEFGELWTRHNVRLNEFKLLILKALEKMEEKDALVLQDFEVRVNLSLDILRQEYNKEKLEGQFNGLITNFDSIKDKLESVYINQVAVIEEFYKIMRLEADVLSSEIKEFIYTKHRQSFDYKIDDEERLVVEALHSSVSEITFGNRTLEFSSKISSIKYWSAEIRTALVELSNNTRELVAWRAEEWVKTKVEEISRKFQTQLELHEKRYERVRNQIYEVRLQEIEVHQQVYDEHKAGVDEVFQKLNRKIDDFYERCSTKLEEHRGKVALVLEEAKKEKKPSSVKYTQTHMIKEKCDCMRDVAMQAEQVRSEIELKMSSVRQSNLKFMKSIKLFNENGNYDVEEAKNFITLLESIDRDSNTEAKNMIKETSRRETEIVQKSSEIYDEANRILSQLYEEVRFNSDVENIISLCKSEFRDLALSLKEDFELLEKQNDSVAICTTDETTFLSEREDEQWLLLLNELYKNVCNLFYTVDLPQWSDLSSDITFEASEKTKTTESGRPKHSLQDSPILKGNDSAAAGKGDGYNCKDFREELFDSNFCIEGGSVFVNIVCKKLWNYMDCLQRSGYGFYKKAWSKSLVRLDLLKPNYDEFGLEAFNTLRAFALQCEQIWLQTVASFLPLLGQIKMSFKAYFNRRTREYAEKVTAALDNNEVEFSKCFDEIGSDLVNELQRLDKKLLPLHGYPRNSQLLNSLEEEVVRKTAELELNWELFIKRFKSKMKCFKMIYLTEEKEWQTLRCLYERCREILFSNELGSDILNTLNVFVEKRGFIKKDLPLLNTNATNLFLSHDAGFRHLNKHDLSTQLDESLNGADRYLQEIQWILERETFDPSVEAGRQSDVSPGNIALLWEPKLGLLDEAESFDAMIDPLMKRMENRHKEVKELILSKKEFQKSIIIPWLDKWKDNVATIRQLYRVKYPESQEPSEDSFSSMEVAVMSMAELKTIKSKTKKISASTTSTLPKLSQKKTNGPDPAYSITSRKSRSVGSRSFSNEKKCHGIRVDNGKKNSRSSKTMQTEKKPEVIENERTVSNTSLSSVSPSKRHSHIPVPSRFQTNSPKPGGRKIMPHQITSPRGTVNRTDTKTALGQAKTNSCTVSEPKSPSPTQINQKQTASLEKKTNSMAQPSCSNATNDQILETTGTDPSITGRTISPKKNSAESNLNYTKSYTTITLSSPRAGSDTPMVESPTRESHYSSTYTTDEASPTDTKDMYASASMSRASLDFDFDSGASEGCPSLHSNCHAEFTDHCSDVPSIGPLTELLDLSFNNSESQLSLNVTESPKLPIKRTVSEDLQNKNRKELIHTPRTTIRSPSGEELVLSPSMEFEIGNDLEGEDEAMENEIINMLLKETEDDTFVKAFCGISVIEDDANEYDSDEATDADIPSETKYVKSKSDFVSCHKSQFNNYKSENEIGEGSEQRTSWKSREHELLTDVNYRQFVYHPTVLRRQTREECHEEMERTRSKSIEERSSSGFGENDHEETGSRKCSFKKKNMSQTFVSNRDVNITPLRAWSEKAPQNEENQIYDSLHLMQNSEYVLKEIKRERSKRERITCAVLRLTVKFIHLLAILNLWPGDNCQLLTSHSTRYRR